MAEMGILINVDKCMRCNGCVISCKRTWDMKALNPGVHKIAPDQRVIIKSQHRVDMGPFIRYSCWHCPNPPCIKRCPFNALAKQANGAVTVDPTLCDPDSPLCAKQCQTDCQRGGYPRIGVGSNKWTTRKAFKCTLCYPVDADGKPVAVGVTGDGAGLDGNLPTRIVDDGGYHSPLDPTEVVPDLAHEPTCVYTCPAKAMTFDTKANIIAHLQDPAQGWMSSCGDGAMFWGSKKDLLLMPKADPFAEDHASPMLEGLLSGPLAKAALVPTLVAGGIFLLSARRAKLEKEASEAAGEVR